MPTANLLSKTKNADIATASALPIHALAACWLGMVFDGMDTNNYILTLHPALAELLHTTSTSIIGWHSGIILGLFMVGWAIGAVCFGILADYIGRTRTLIFSVLTYALCTGLCALSHTWQEMALWRFLVGCGIGGEISVGGVMLAELWKGNKRLHATGFLQTGFPCGILLLSALNLSIGHFGWRWLYVAGVIPALLAFYMRLKLSDAPDAQKARAFRTELKTKERSILNNQELSYLKHPFLELFQKQHLPKILSILVMSSCACIGTYAVVGWVPAWINQLTGTAAVQERSYALFAQSLGNILSTASAGLVVLAIGRKLSFRIVFGGALIVCPLMFLTTKSFGTPLLIWAFLAGCLVLAPFAYLFIYVPELFETRLRATAFAFGIQSGRIMAGIACLISGQLVGFFNGSYAMAGASISMVYVLGLITTFFMPSSPGKVSETKDEIVTASIT